MPFIDLNGIFFEVFLNVKIMLKIMFKPST